MADAQLSEVLTEARIDLTAALRWAERGGLSEGICNHFSFALPGTDDRFLINPQGMHWSEITASSLLLVDAEGIPCGLIGNLGHITGRGEVRRG